MNGEEAHRTYCETFAGRRRLKSTSGRASKTERKNPKTGIGKYKRCLRCEY